MVFKRLKSTLTSGISRRVKEGKTFREELHKARIAEAPKRARAQAQAESRRKATRQIGGARSTNFQRKLKATNMVIDDLFGLPTGGSTAQRIGRGRRPGSRARKRFHTTTIVQEPQGKARTRRKRQTRPDGFDFL